MNWDRFLLNFIMGFVCGMIGFFAGYRCADSYWKKRIEERPESIHWGKYDTIPGIPEHLKPHLVEPNTQCNCEYCSNFRNNVRNL